MPGTPRHSLLTRCLEARAAARLGVECGEPADLALARFFSKNRHYGARDRRVAAAAVFAEFRWQGWLAEVADPILRLAAALWLDGEYDTAVRLAPHFLPDTPPTDLSGKAEWAARVLGKHQTFALTDLTPRWAFEEIGRGDAQHFALFLEAVQRRPPLWLRARAGHAEEVLEELKKRGYTAELDARRPHAIRVEGAVSREVLALILHKKAEVQDIASQEVIEFCAPRQGERWWDVCAGAGGKTLHLLDRLQDRGFVLATDVRSPPLAELSRRASQSGFLNWQALCLAAPEEMSGNYFDGVLVDAPCSGSGTWGRAPDARWRVHEQDLVRFRERQLRISVAAARCVRPGGRLVYAVCSLAKSETDDVASEIASRSGLQLARVRRIGPEWGPGIGMWCAEFLRP